MFVVYRSPTDYPGQFVLRRTVVDGRTIVPDVEPMVVASSLESVRAGLPDGLYNLGRYPDDEPQIYEVWV